MSSKTEYTKHVRIGLVFAFLVLIFFRFSPVLTTEGLGLVLGGDGIGTLSWLAVIHEQLNHSWLDYLFSDFWENHRVGMGLMASTASWGLFWKVVLIPVLLLGFEPQQIYDILSLMIFVMTVLSAVLLGRVLAIPLYLSLYLGVCLALMDNSVARLSGHLTLSASFGLILQIAAALSAAKKQRIWDHFVLGLASWLSFSVNEYLGVFGLIAAVMSYVLGLFVFGSAKGEFIQNLKRISSGVLVGLISFIVLMVVSYPTMFAAAIGISSNDIAGQVTHSVGELVTYGVNNPSQLWSYYTATAVDYRNPGEFTFRVGLAAFVVFVTMLLLNLLKESSSRNGSSTQLDYRLIILFAVVAVALTPFGLSPNTGWSLAPVVHSVLPMIRVPARAFLVIDICVLSALVLAVNSAQKNYIMNSMPLWRRLVAGSVILVALFWVFFDVTRGRPIQLNGQKLPTNYQLIKDNVSAPAAGWLLELPFYSPSDAPELSYEYLYNWAHHKIPILNAPFHLLQKTNPGLARQLELFADELNWVVSDNTLERLGLNGTQYIVSNCNDASKKSLLQSSELTLLASDGCQQLFKINSFINGGRPSSLLKKYEAQIPNPSVRITPDDCKKFSLTTSSITTPVSTQPGSRIVVNVTLTYRGVTQIAGGGADVRLGGVWFDSSKSNDSHEPNHGEKWVGMPLLAGEPPQTEIIAKFNAPPKPGDYLLYISPMQPGNLWCFHVNAPPLIIPITVELP